jgi:hypothetical protein
MQVKTLDVFNEILDRRAYAETCEWLVPTCPGYAAGFCRSILPLQNSAALQHIRPVELSSSLYSIKAGLKVRAKSRIKNFCHILTRAFCII